MRTINELLDEAGKVFIYRLAWKTVEDVPPGACAVWSSVEGLWVESDMSLRKRITRGEGS